MQKQRLVEIAKRDPSIFWDVKSIANLSVSALLERIINYGNYEQFQAIFELDDLDDPRILSENIRQLIQKKRSNLRPAAANLANIYLQRKLND